MLMLDRVARRYGKAPHEIARVDGADWILDLECCLLGIKHDQPQPVVLVMPKK